MKKLLILAPFLLTACGDKYDLQVSVPPLPERYQKAEKLPPIKDNKVSTLLQDGIETDIKYNDVASKYNSLIDLYNCVRESINNREIKCD